MLTVAQSLQAVTLYPINPITLQNICEEQDLAADAEAKAAVRRGNAYKRALAAVYLYLATAPQVTEAGATYNFTDEQRNAFRAKAKALNAEAGNTGEALFEVGYVGEDF